MKKLLVLLGFLILFGFSQGAVFETQAMADVQRMPFFNQFSSSLLVSGDKVIQLSFGRLHSGALTESGKVFTWGFNSSGQLGDNSTTDRWVPTDITSQFPIDDKVIQISLGLAHSSALTQSGRVFLWGWNNTGRLGDGTTTNRWIPTEITSQFPINDKVIQVQIGGTHSSALTQSGRVYLWGVNNSGQLGDGTIISKLVPTEITHQFPVDDLVKALSIGGNHSAALTESGKVYTWGLNTSGQIGDDSTTSRLVPLNISSNFPVGDPVIQISLGAGHSSVLTESGRVFTWGRNHNGQLGNNSTTNRLLPTEVSSSFPVGEKVIKLSVGYYHSSAITETNKVFIWGNNEYGQIGDSSISDKLIPNNITSRFPSGEKVVSVSLGDGNSSALTESGKLYIWGLNFYGQLGDSTTTNKHIPTLLTSLSTPFTNRITFISNGGSAVSPIDELAGTQIVAPVHPTKTGHTFAGWYSDVELTQGYIFDTMPGSNITLYAKWTINQYTISFNSDGGSVVDSITQDYNTSVSAPSSPTRVGYTFNGWSQAVPTNMPAESITLTAGWTINQYTISFDSNGGSAVASITQDFNSSVSAPTNPTKTGYTFNGWSQALPTNMPAESITLTAGWTINQYTITFNSNNGSAVSPITQDYNTVVSAPANPTRVGHTFIGWSPSVPANMPAESITLTAGWTINQYTITFNSSLGSAVSSITQNYNTAVNAPTAPTRLGYTFGGWYSDSELTTTFTFSTMPGESITLYAKWNTVAYNITYHLNGGVNHGSNPATYHVETPTVLLENPTKTGYSFHGWYDNVDLTGSALTQIVLGSTGNRTYYAKWTINQYTITFDAVDGSPSCYTTQNYNTAIGPACSPSKVGHNFVGWSQPIPTHMPAENITLTAIYAIRMYQMNFNTAGGTSVPGITLNYDTPIPMPQPPTKVGYTFSGWSPEIPEKMPNYNPTITALWTINSYTISFNSDGGSAVASITQDYNTSVTAPAIPTRVGYTFNGWSQAVPTNMPGENLTLTAQWIAHSFTITFDSSGGSAVASITQDYNTSVTAPANPSRVGYTFNGWSQAVPANMPAENLTLTAQWTINQYTITFNSDGGSAVASIIQDYNTSVTAPAIPTRVGYTFNGWSPALPTNIPANNLSLTALWTINQYTIFFNTSGGSSVASITQDYNTSVSEPANP
ncbi:MAG: InlB B-repeat-containing protein, partial [bacterium]|nr:InlB B-repeat-containing protein [bacterium]